MAYRVQLMVWDEPVCIPAIMEKWLPGSRGRGNWHRTGHSASPTALGIHIPLLLSVAPWPQSLWELWSRLEVRGWKWEVMALPCPPQITPVLDHNDSYHLVIAQSNDSNLHPSPT